MRISFLLFFLFSYSSLVKAESVSFESTDLGYGLTLSKKMRWLYNPHSMRKTPIYIDNTWVGAFTVSVIPDSLTAETFIQVGDGYYKEKYPNSVVASMKEVNDMGLKFYRVSAEFKVDDEKFIDERYIFIKPRKSPNRVAPLNMTYTFNFKYKKALYSEIKKELLESINSFNLFENSWLTNEAIKLNAGL